MTLVEKYKVGNTKIEIYDDAYKDKTQKDIDRAFKGIADIIINANAERTKNQLSKEAQP